MLDTSSLQNTNRHLDQFLDLPSYLEYIFWRWWFKTIFFLLIVMHIPIPKEELGSNKESFIIRYRITLNYRPWACYVHTIPVTELEEHDTVVEENVLIYSKTTYKIRESPSACNIQLPHHTFLQPHTYT